MGPAGALATVDIFDNDGSFAAAPPMSQARAQAACVTLANGTVLVTGGDGGSGALSSAEIFDPIAGAWTPAGNLTSAREGHKAVLTMGGNVWIAGGTNQGAIVGTVELFAAGRFRTVGSLNTPRNGFAMTALGERNLLIAGGTDGANTLNTVEAYDSLVGTISVAGTMLQARKDFAAAALLDGRILFTGGVDPNGSVLSTTEIFDSVEGTSVAGPALLAPRSNHSAYSLPGNGSILIYGGTGNSLVLNTSEIYTPWTGAVTSTTALNAARRDHASAILHPGSLLAAGGRDDNGPLSSSELYQFANVQTDKRDYAPGTAVHITGGGWIPGEQVMVQLTAYPVDQHHVEFTGAAVADGAGNIKVDGFSVDRSHLGMKFLMTASGSQSEAQGTFTDGLTASVSVTATPPGAGAGSVIDITVTVTGGGSIPAGIVQLCDNTTALADGACPSNYFQGPEPGYTCGDIVVGYCDLVVGATSSQAVMRVQLPAGTTSFGAIYIDTSLTYNPVSAHQDTQLASYTALAGTTLALSGPVSASYGSATPYQATVTVTGGGTATGNVYFCDNLAGTCTGAGDPTLIGTVSLTNTSNNVATFNPSPALAVGSHKITAYYAGNSSNGSSTSNSFATTVVIATTTTTITNIADLDPTSATQIGRLITITAQTVTSPNVFDTPTGSFTFKFPQGAVQVNNVSGAGCGNLTNGATQATVTTTTTSLNTGAGGFGTATATCTFLITQPAAQTNSYLVTYNGDTNTSPSTTATASTITTILAHTTTVLSISSPDGNNPTQLGRQITLTATTTTDPQVFVQPGGNFTFTLPAGVFTAATSTCSAPTVTGSNFVGGSIFAAPVNGVVQRYLALTGNGQTVATCKFIVVGPTPATTAGTTTSYVNAVSYGQDTSTLASTVSNTPSLTTIPSLSCLVPNGSITTTCLPSLLATQGSFPSNTLSGPYVYGQPISIPVTVGTLTATTAGGITPGLPSAGFAPTGTVTLSGIPSLGIAPTVTLTPAINGLVSTATLISPPSSSTGAAGTGAVPGVLPVGNYSLSLSYSGDNRYAAYQPSGATPTINFTIGKANTTTALQALTVPAGVQNLRVVVANASYPGQGVPTGTVQVTVGGPGTQVVTTGLLSPSNNCAPLNVTQCSVATVLVSSGTYVGVYGGDSNFNSSASNGSGTGVNAVVASSSVALTATPNSPQPGQTVLLTAVVNGLNGPGNPTGSVSFTDNGTIIGVATVVAGIATFSTTLGPGSHTISATYSGDSTYPGSSATMGVTVFKPVPTATFSSNITTSVYGQQVILTVRFTGATQGAALPTGTVQFVSNGQPIGSPVQIVNGVATLTLSNLPTGVDNVGVLYNGDSSYSNLTKNAGTVQVNQAQTMLSLTSKTSGSQMTLTATLAVVSPGAGTPTGTVQFIDSLTQAVLGTATVTASGVTTLTIAVTGDPIVAVYSGDTNFMTSTSPKSISPTITLTNSASYTQSFSPGEIVDVFGTGLTAQPVSGTLPLTNTLGGITVMVTDSAGVPRQASLFYVSPNQLAFLTPPQTAPGVATVTVTTSTGSLTATMTVTPSTSDLYTANASGSGPLAAQVVATTPGGQQTYLNTAALNGTTYVNSPISLAPASSTFYLLLYGTGFDNAKTVTVTINGQSYNPAYAGAQGTYPGLDQINVLLPASLVGAGQVNVSITVDGQVSNVGNIAFASGGTN